MANNAAFVTAGLFIIYKITFNQPSLRIPSYVKHNTNPVRAHATRENSYPDLESLGDRPLTKEPEVSGYEIKPESTHNMAKVCYFTKTRS